jgi:hypothetical protein
MRILDMRWIKRSALTAMAVLAFAGTPVSALSYVPGETVWVTDIWIVSGEEVWVSKELMYDGHGWFETGNFEYIDPPGGG